MGVSGSSPLSPSIHSRQTRTPFAAASRQYNTTVPPYRCEVYIRPRADILDPQGDAVARALASLGFSGVGEVRIGRYVIVELEASSESAALSEAETMCQKLLANPVTEDFELHLKAGA